MPGRCTGFGALRSENGAGWLTVCPVAIQNNGSFWTESEQGTFAVFSKSARGGAESRRLFPSLEALWLREIPPARVARLLRDSAPPRAQIQNCTTFRT